MYQVLAKIAEVKPEFIFSMGRLKDDFLPPITLLYGIGRDEARISNFDNLERKLSLSMLNFLTRSKKAYEHEHLLEEIDK